MIVEGQDHGAAAHGLAAALFEKLDYDSEGQLRSSTFMDYLAPTAADLCDVQVGHVETRSPFTLLGTKGMGEGCGTPLPAMANAIEDALSANNIQTIIVNSHNSPEEIWKTIRSERKETI